MEREIRDLMKLKDMDLGIVDAKIVVEELAAGRIGYYWSDRQLAWKVQLCDVRRIEVESPSGLDPDFLSVSSGWVRGWPLICVDEEKDLVKIGWESPEGLAVWIWVELFQLDDSNLLSGDEPFLVKEYEDLLVA